MELPYEITNNLNVSVIDRLHFTTGEYTFIVRVYRKLVRISIHKVRKKISINFKKIV